MLILGECPDCSAEDTLRTHQGAPSDVGMEEWKKVTCGACKQSWPSWLGLVFGERREGRRLIPVDIATNPYCVNVWWPRKDDVPCARLIINVVNTALMVRFGLKICLSTEGGVEGLVRGHYVELSNGGDDIGLFAEHSNPVVIEILNWYASVLRVLFEEELVVGGRSFGRGAILKLSPEAKDYESEVMFFLWLALRRKTRSKRFAAKVFERMSTELSNAFSAPYLAGLSDEDIIKRFVPPPLG